MLEVEERKGERIRRTVGRPRDKILGLEREREGSRVSDEEVAIRRRAVV